MNKPFYFALTLAAFLLPALAQAEQKPDVVTQTFAVKLGATRIIYNPDSAGATLPVINVQDYPILVQSRVVMDDRKTPAPFVVTPPLFRLDGGQQNQLRIVRTGGTFAQDRETLNWLCVTGIPPKADDLWGQTQDGKALPPKNVTLQFQVRVNNCVRLLVRPSAIRGTPDDVASSVTWSREGGRLKATNPTPFYMNLASLSVGGKEIRGAEAIPPLGTQTYALPAGASGDVTWKVITDFGGEGRAERASLK